ncbi:helix-turn-helix transcriptional regulator [Paenibacillus daejeonensis]|uniref:helix-turn-helix transcriptional regulator n=1 Tax=Paenibacillus daejeonensis TaxID=135193 RepID=UPI000367D0FA|nr:YafY family protein [Paenibacillus daejeonensis]
MNKAERLIALMMTVNRMRKFTVQELADQFGVSRRTMLRDLQELSGMGVPLYAEPGPHGGYQVLRERILPPIAFTEEEALSIFFASHALRHYKYLPFEQSSASARDKFYLHMSGEVRERIDRMKQRFDLRTPARHAESPHLSRLLEAAIQNEVLEIRYERGASAPYRAIQPIGIYASQGLWYCPAYCYERDAIRLFRCDRMLEVRTPLVKMEPMDLSDVHLGNRHVCEEPPPDALVLQAELTVTGVQRCETEQWAGQLLGVHSDGSGELSGGIDRSDLGYFAGFLIGLGMEVCVLGPASLIEEIKLQLVKLTDRYG